MHTAAFPGWEEAFHFYRKDCRYWLLASTTTKTLKGKNKYLSRLAPHILAFTLDISYFVIYVHISKNITVFTPKKNNI